MQRENKINMGVHPLLIDISFLITILIHCPADRPWELRRSSIRGFQAVIWIVTQRKRCRVTTHVFTYHHISKVRFSVTWHWHFQLGTLFLSSKWWISTQRVSEIAVIIRNSARVPTTDSLYFLKRTYTAYTKDAMWHTLTYRTFIAVLSSVNSGRVTNTVATLAGAIAVTQHLKNIDKMIL